MMAEIYEDSLNKFLMSPNDGDLAHIISEKHLSLAELYDTFFIKAIERQILKNKSALYSRDDIYNGYLVFAVEKTFERDTALKALLTTRRYYETLQSFKINVESKQSVAFQIMANKPKFTHLTFREYCVAKYIFDFIGKTKLCFYQIQFVNFLIGNDCIRNFLLEMANDEITKRLKNHPHLLKSFKYLGHYIIFWSIERDYINIVKCLLDHFIHRTRLDEQLIEKKVYQNILHIAVKFNQLDLVKTFISEVNSRDKTGKTPIFLAKSVGVFEFLIANGAKLDIKDEDENTALHHVVCRGVEFVRKICDLKDSNEVCLSEYIFHKNRQGQTPLDKAASIGEIEVILFLFEKSLLNNLPAEDRQTSPLKSYPTLLETCQRNKVGRLMNIAIAKRYELSYKKPINREDIRNIKNACQLIGIDVKSVNSDGETVLHIAAKLESRELFEFFLQNGADPEIQSIDGLTPFHVAVQYSKDVAQFLLDNVEMSNLKARDGNTVLHYAAMSSDSIVLKQVISQFKKRQISLDEKNSNSETSLRCATKIKMERNVQILLNAGALPNFSSNIDIQLLEKYLEYVFNFSKTNFLMRHENSKQILKKYGCEIDWSKVLGKYRSLHTAAEWGLVNVVKLMITYNVDVNGLDERGRTPLMCAKKKESYELLLSAGAKNYLKGKYGNTRLHRAVKNRNMEMVEYFIITDPSLIKEPNNYGETALHIAATHFDGKIVKLLIQKEADVNLPDKKGSLPINYSMKANSISSFLCLMEHSAKVDLLDDNGILKEELNFLYESEVFVKLLIQKQNFIVNVADTAERTPLHIAARYSNLKVFQVLIGEGANVDAEDNNGNIPLHHAAECSFLNDEALSYLIDYSSDIDHKNKDGNTPLMVFCSKMQNAKWIHLSRRMSPKRFPIEILLAKKARPELANKDGNTPLHLAIINKREEWALHLIKHSTELDKQNKKDETALHLAVIGNDFEIVKALIAKQADCNIKNGNSKTALDLAAEEKERKDIFDFLTNHSLKTKTVEKSESELESESKSLIRAKRLRKRRLSADF